MALTASTAGYATVNAYEMAYGRFFTEQDDRSQARIVVLGWQTAKDLFGGLNPVGRTVKINGIPFEVVGLFKSKGSSGFNNQDETMVVPVETGYAKLFGASVTSGGKRLINGVYISAASADDVDTVMAGSERIMRRQHRLSPTADSDFSILSQAQILDVLGAVTATLTVFLGAIAGISLLVGGIGIMNIMLVSVTERTREIGLRKAVGARRLAIMSQFLIETLVLSLLGGGVGVALGWGVAAAVRAADLIQAQVTLDSVLLAFFFSAAVGVFFGLYPAWRASRLRPIEALRYE